MIKIYVNYLLSYHSVLLIFAFDSILSSVYNTAFRMILICWGSVLRDDENDFLLSSSAMQIKGKLLKVVMLLPPSIFHFFHPLWNEENGGPG